MSKKIDVDKIADEVFRQIIESYNQDVKNAALKAEKEESMAVLLDETSGALRRYMESFTITLVQRVVDELNLSDD